MKIKRFMALMLAAVMIVTTPAAVFADDAGPGFDEASGEAESLPVELEEEFIDEVTWDENYYEEPELLTEEDYNYDASDMLIEENAQAFSDIPPSHNFYKAIQWAAEEGIAGGYKDGTFRSGEPCTRGQIIKFIWNYEGKPNPKSTKQKFKDVPKSHGYFKAIQWAAEEGITAGYDDGTFGVNEPCTRGHIVTFIWRAEGKPTPHPQWESTDGKVQLFPDVPVKHNFYTAVLWAFTNNIAAGYVSGSKAGKFGLSDACTRGQAVTFFYRMNRKPIHIQQIQITSSTPISVATGMTKKIKYSVTPTNNNDAVVITSGDTKIATAKPDGTIKGVKKGSTRVNIFTSSGLHVYTTVNVYENVSDNWSYSTNVSDYSYDLTVQPTKIYYSGSDLVMEAFVVNNTMRNVTKFSPIEVTVKMGSTQVAKKKWSTYTLNLKPYTMIKKTFKFPGAKMVDLTSDVVTVSYTSSYYYNYG